MKKMNMAVNTKKKDEKLGYLLKEFYGEKIPEVDVFATIFLIALPIILTIALMNVDLDDKERFFPIIWSIFPLILVGGTIYNFEKYKKYNLDIFVFCTFYEYGFEFKKYYSDTIEKVYYQEINYIDKEPIKESYSISSNGMSDIDYYELFVRYKFTTSNKLFFLNVDVEKDEILKMFEILIDDFKIYNSLDSEREDDDFRNNRNSVETFEKR